MMAGNPNWWSMNDHMHPQLLYTSNSSLSPNSSESDHHLPHDQAAVSAAAAVAAHADQDFRVRSWSQLILGGLSGIRDEETRFGGGLYQAQQKKMENSWEDEALNMNPIFTRDCGVDVKQEVTQTGSCHLFSGHNLDYDQSHGHQFQPGGAIFQTPHSTWPHQPIMPVSSPTSCITNLSNSLLNFSAARGCGEGAVTPAVVERKNNRHNQEHSSECNSTRTVGASKKPRVQPSSSQPTLKVRKEKLSERVASLHQIVSPFGKTDTATVLSEAIGYIRFLHAQIEALSSPYMRNASQVSHDLEGRVVQDLRSRGLCLVPISCTQHVGNDNGGDYWAPSALGGGF